MSWIKVDIDGADVYEPEYPEDEFEYDLATLECDGLTCPCLLDIWTEPEEF